MASSKTGYDYDWKSRFCKINKKSTQMSAFFNMQQVSLIEQL
jgi:hypothetical protein